MTRRGRSVGEGAGITPSEAGTSWRRPRWHSFDLGSAVRRTPPAL